MRAEDLVSDPWAFGPYCYVIGEVIAFPTPILGVRGWQGTWPLDQAMQQRMRELTGQEIIRGFTLREPYASAVAYGPKRIENRPQPRQIPPGGLWLGLHAGKELYGDEEEASKLLHLWRGELAVPGPYPFPRWEGAPQVDALPRSAMLGAMRIDQCLRYPVGRPERHLPFADGAR